MEVAGNLVANTDAVTQQVEKGNDLQERKWGGDGEGQNPKLLYIILDTLKTSRSDEI